MENRINKLDKRIQEYFYLGQQIGFFNSNNIERVLTRLERVKFSIDNNNPGNAQTVPIRDQNNVRISHGLDVRINENRIKNTSQYFFEDEVIFHELTHCVNAIYEKWFENLALWYDYDKVFNIVFPENKDKIEALSSNPEFRQRYYCWLVLDEFVAQYISQKMVEVKYGKKIYPSIQRTFNKANPPIEIESDFSNYWEFTDIVKKFVETIYGKCDLNRFCIEALEPKIIRTIFASYKNKKNGLDYLYSLLGNMGNIGFVVASRNFTPQQIASDSDMTARTPENVSKYYEQCISIPVSIAENRVIVPGVVGHFD